MKTHTITLNLTVAYDLQGTDPDELQEMLTQVFRQAMANGAITGDTEAEVDEWSMRVNAGDSEEDATQVSLLTERVFAYYLDVEGTEYFPEAAYREICLESDGPKWRSATRKLGGYEACKLEVDDKPAFRQGLNDHADAMVKDRQWVTFNGGNSYYDASDIKDAIRHFDPSEYEYEPTLRAKIDFWL